MRRALLILVLLATFVPRAFAHELRPAYLQVRQTGPETYDVLWKVPALGGLAARIAVVARLM